MSPEKKKPCQIRAFLILVANQGFEPWTCGLGSVRSLLVMLSSSSEVRLMMHLPGRYFNSYRERRNEILAPALSAIAGLKPHEKIDVFLRQPGELLFDCREFQ